MQDTVYTKRHEDWQRIQAVEVLLVGVEVTAPANLNKQATIHITCSTIKTDKKCQCQLQS